MVAAAACIDTDGGNLVGRQHDRPERNGFGCLRPQRHSCERSNTPASFLITSDKPSRKNILCMLTSRNNYSFQERFGKPFDTIASMSAPTDEFYRISEAAALRVRRHQRDEGKARAAQQDVVDLGMGNPDGADAAPRGQQADRGGPQSAKSPLFDVQGHPTLREEIVQRYKTKYDVDLDPATEAIVTIGAKDALAHLLFAVIGPGDAVVSPNPAYPIHQYGVIMAEGHACMLPMPDAGYISERARRPVPTQSRASRS